MAARGGDLAGRLAEWAMGLGLDHVPGPVVHAARRSLLDVTGCALAGTSTPVSKALRQLAPRLYGEGRSHLMGDSARINPMGAAMVNAVACAALEYDNTLGLGRMHAAAVIFPAVLAVSEAIGSASLDLLTGFIAGMEVAGVINEAAGTGIARRGWSVSASAGLLGAVAGACRVTRLDAATAAHALRIAGVHVGGLALADGTTVRATMLASAAETAIRSMLLANDGMAGPPAALEGRGGMLSVLAGPRPSGGGNPWAALGERWSLLDPGLTFKLHPMASMVLPALEEAAHILHKNRISSRSVRRITCTLSAQSAERLIAHSPTTVPQAQHSLRFAIACLLTFGTVHVGHLRRSVMEGPSLTEAMERVVVVGSSDGLAGDTGMFDHSPHAAQVDVQTADGRVISGLRLGATGGPSTPLSDADLEAKFIANAKMAGMSEPKARLMAGRVWDMPR